MGILDFIMDHFLIVILVITLGGLLFSYLPSIIKLRKATAIRNKVMARLESEGVYNYYESLSNEELAKAYIELETRIEEIDQKSDEYGFSELSYREDLIDEILDNREADLTELINKEISTRLENEGVYRHYESLSDEELLKAYKELEEREEVLDMDKEIEQYEIYCRKDFIEEISGRRNIKLTDERID